MNIIRNMTFSNTCVPNLARHYAFKSDLKIKWVPPEKIPAYKPVKSGDLVPIPKFEKSQLQSEFQNCKELTTANDLVKKLFTLEYAPKYKTTSLYMRELIESVKRHNQDEGSVEVKIARWTGVIRAMQEVMEQSPGRTRLKVRLQELIDKRKKHLKYLRRWDYKKFEWLIDNLNIIYKAPPKEYYPVTRKDSLRKLTNKYCEDIKNERLKAYRLQLEAEQPAFLQEKINILEFIRKEQEECNVDVTISQKEIDDVKEQLKVLLEKRQNLDNGTES